MRRQVPHPTPETAEAPSPAPSEKPGAEDSGFRPFTEDCPYGIPLLVRGNGVEEGIAIRSHAVGWYNEARTQRLAIQPTEWAYP